jgi:hypothetical protein
MGNILRSSKRCARETSRCNRARAFPLPCAERCAVEDVRQLDDEGGAHAAQVLVLHVELLHDAGHLRCARLDARERQVLLRMMDDIGVLRHVEHDVEHELVVGRQRVVKELELGLEAVEKLAEGDVLGVPLGETVGHVRSFPDAKQWLIVVLWRPYG